MKIGETPNKPTFKQLFFMFLVITVLYGALLPVMFSVMGYDDFSIQNVVIQTLVFGVLMTFWFAKGAPWVAKRFNKSKAITITPELLPGELIEAEGPANLFRGVEGVGGKLFLTNSHVVFKSHKINLQKGQTNIPYASITSVAPRKTGMFFNNGLAINTQEGTEYHFVVNARDTWLAELQKRLQ